MLDPDPKPHLIQNSGGAEVSDGAMEGTKARMVCRPAVQIRITLLRSWIRIRVKVKSQIRIRIKVSKMDPDPN